MAASYRAGDIVWTRYGAGVIVAKRQTDDASSAEGNQADGASEPSKTPWIVRLWRVPGKSVGSATLAYLDPSMIEDLIPAAPGMLAELKSKEQPVDGDQAESKPQRVLVLAYYRNENSFLVCDPGESGETANVNMGTTIPQQKQTPGDDAAKSGGGGAEGGLRTSHETARTISASDIAGAPAAKFYPVLETLMARGDETASQAAKLLQDEKTKKIVEVAEEQIQGLASQVPSSDAAADSVEENVENLVDQVEKVAQEHTPTEPQIQQVLTMIKDQELTTLLQDCKERLEKLVSTDLPEATKVALEKTGIHIKSEGEGDGDNEAGGTENVFAKNMESSRKAALEALQDLLDKADVDPSELEKVGGEMSQKFSETFDSLAAAAKSDRGLNELFETVAEKTTEWQEASGRLLQTRSASLFLEGASRIQARAAQILQMQWAGGGEVGSKLTKAFTEKDAALARLKSIELGDAVKNRLVDAIQVRSQLTGGLDGIIAGALTKVRDTSKGSSGQMKTLLSNLHSSASSATTSARETLISVLSHRSEYRDVALLRIEGVMCELESQFGKELSPEDIASIARGEGGTATLFEPIAKRAVEQIDKQLDMAESQVSDKTVLAVLQRVRKITSGELTLSALTDEIVGILNDEKIVAASESLVQHSEKVLDAIEGVSSNKVVSGALKIAEKAGITKDSVMKEFEKLDVNQLLDTAGGAVTDESKRQKLLSSATDTALDFILRILPSMPVPPFEGVKDGLVYNIANLSMEGFKVRKEDIYLELAGMSATKMPKPTEPLNGGKPRRRFRRTRSAEFREQSAGERPAITSVGSDLSDDASEASSRGVKASELLIIDVRRISAILDQTTWSFEQTYLPYLKGNGLADIKLSDGAIRLQFELRRRPKESEDGEKKWEPVLCLHDRSCSIGGVELNLQGGGRLGWIVNKLAAIFKGPLRDYVVRTIVRVLTNRSGWILERLNSVLSPYWDLILKTAKLSMDDLAEATAEDIVAAVSQEDPSLVELVWRDRLPLGMNLLLNDESGSLKVVDFPRGSQARLVCEKRNMNPDVFKGATIVAVNGKAYDEQNDLFEALKDPARPKTVQFRLADTADAERVRRFVEGGDAATKKPKEASPRQILPRTVRFDTADELGIMFESSLDNSGLEVASFVEGQGGIILAAQRKNEIKIGDLLIKVNGKVVVGSSGEGRAKSLKALEEFGSQRPLELTFVEGYLFQVTLNRLPEEQGTDRRGGPEELLLGEHKDEDDGRRRVLIQDFNPISGMAEHSGILIGDHLVFVNGTPVGAGVRWLGEGTSPTLEEVYELLCNKSFYPMGLTFARPKQAGDRRQAVSREFSDSEADTICVTTERQDRIGCIFDTTENGDIVVSDFHSVPGVVQKALSKLKNVNGSFDVAIDAINGEFVPSYASADMVMNALKRSWMNEKKMEIVLCDDERKKFINSLTDDDTNT